MFLDEVRIRVRSGAGGPGAVAFRREKYVPKGGPDGGDGGRGANIFLVGTAGLNSLSHFRGRTLITGDRGGSGSRSLRHGADADDVRLLVPVGTVVMDTRPATSLARSAPKATSFESRAADAAVGATPTSPAAAGRRPGSPSWGTPPKSATSASSCA